MPETSFMIDNTSSPTNPNPKVFSTLTVSFNGNEVPKGKYLGFRLATFGGNNNFKFTTTNTEFFEASLLTIADSDNTDCTSTIIWSTDVISAKNIISSIPISIECVAEEFSAELTTTFTIELYIATSGISLLNLKDIGKASTTNLEPNPRQLEVTAVLGKITSTIESFYPNALNAPNDRFNHTQSIALKITIIKDPLSQNIESLVVQTTIPTTAINYSSGTIYISKVNNTGQITDFNGTTIESENYYSANLNGDSNGIDVTTTPGAIVLTLLNLDVDQRSKFFNNTDGVIFPLYVFIIGTII